MFQITILEYSGSQIKLFIFVKLKRIAKHQLNYQESRGRWLTFVLLLETQGVLVSLILMLQTSLFLFANCIPQLFEIGNINISLFRVQIKVRKCKLDGSSSALYKCIEKILHIFLS